MFHLTKSIGVFKSLFLINKLSDTFLLETQPNNVFLDHQQQCKYSF